ncbi:MAG TPA: polysaccharide deacetylase family protein [Polyangiales bacterium]|nr:polysaccharide deacetylase family protein [Polyangiales bacterium]
MALLKSARDGLVSYLKPKVRDLGAALLHRSTLLDPARLARDKLTIATFHRVLPERELVDYPMPGISVTPEELDWLLALFTKHYTVGTLGEMATRFTLGDRPDKPLLAITFDDGQRDNYRHARPILAAYGAHASFFVVADATEHNETLWHDRVAYALANALRAERVEANAFLARLGVAADAADLVHACVARIKLMTPEQRDDTLAELEAIAGGPQRPEWDGMMSWDELKQMHSDGHEIGSHSYSHAILPLITDEQLEQEVAGSRDHLKQRLGFEVDTFCYPNGDCDERVAAAVQRAGYRHAVTTRYGINRSGGSHYFWKRCDMQGSHARTENGHFSEGRMLLRLSGLLPSAS